SRRDDETIVHQANFQRRTLLTPSHHRFEQLLLPLELWPHHVDLLHSPDFIPPFRRTYASVITVHDLAFLRFPHFVTQESAHHYGLIDQAVRRTDHIIAVSESTKADIVNLLGAAERKITVIHEATTPAYRPRLNGAERAEVAAARERYRLQKPFILFVSTIEPRKNLPTLLRAFRRLLDEYKADVELVVVGERGWLFEEVFTLTSELHLDGAVRYLGRVPVEDLPLLYNAAMIHAHPSFYEGFGLTPLEAMSSGTPTVVSNVSSLPEVVGDAGMLVPPNDVEEWTVAMWRLLSDSALRESMIEKGLKRAATFSWEKAARQHLDVYRRFRNGR
ncbi:MAG TPA: glycosyltransferase family 1 protein, partial [Ardenticatenaceae bacterium]|nr:glycosyltransferase family 1 protein [Ardenticatenaceae bacterium]